MIIPFQQLSDEATDNLIKEYCLRDWGLNEVEAPLEERMAQVRSALQAELLVVLYSEHFESARLVSKDELKSLS
jgi:uncharacterized protein YheU (UPF0270 family)